MTRDLNNAAWRKSTYSSANSQCVEVADIHDAVAVRDSKNPTGPVLTIAPASWSALVQTRR